MTSQTQNCPHCGSSDTSFKAKAKVWECNYCEERFPDANFVSDNAIEPQTIFLSYAHKSEREDDYDVSEELVWLIKDELEKDGHQVWIDHEGIVAGSQWRERITHAILNHTHFLSFLSKRSVRDPGVCLNEIAIALGSGRQIQTLLTESEESVRQPLTISHLQWHQFVDWRAIKGGEKTGPKGEGWDAWFGERMAHIRANLSDLQKIKVAGDLQRLKDILDPKTFEADIIAKIEGFYGRRWLFQACENWLNNSTDRLFWLKGSPGIGKSCFAAKLVHQSNSAIVGFFKCEFQGSKSPEESASECIRTLAYQLASRLPDYRTKLLYQQQLEKDKVQKKTADDLFSYLISEPLNISGKIPEATRLALVIDALDEAGRNDGTNALADLLYKHADKLPPWLGVIVTSRPEPYLEQQLGRFDATSIEGGTEQNLQDLRDYLNERLNRGISEPDRTQIIEQIIQKSGGTFLYVKLIEKDKTLDLAKPETLPSGIDDVFMRDFKRYFPNAKEYGQEAEPFLRLLAAAPGPLPINLATDILGWGRREITTKIIQPLGSILQEKGEGLTFFHKSLSDWLQDPKRSGLYHVSDTGAGELGEFLWNEYLRYEQSNWQRLTLDWLPTLLLHTRHWNDLQSLDRYAEFLEIHSKFRSALSVRERHLEVTLNNLSEDIPAVAKAYFKSGVLLGNILDFKSSQIRLIKSLELQKCANPIDDEFYTDTLDALGIVAGGVEARLNDSIDYFQKSIKIKESSNFVHPSSLAKTLNYLAIVRDAKGEFRVANEVYEKAVSIFERNGIPNASDFATLLNNYAIVKLRANGGLVFGKFNPFNYPKLEFQYAKDLMEFAFKIFEILTSGGGNPNLPAILNNLGISHHNLNDERLASESFARSHEFCLNTLGDKHPDLATVLNNQAALSSCFHRDEDSRLGYLRAIRIYEDALGPRHPHVARCLNNLGILEHEIGNFIDARKIYQRAYEIYHMTLGIDHCDTAQILSNLALIDLKEGNFDIAADVFQKVLDSRVNSLGSEHPQVASSYIHLARALSMNNEHQRSYNYYIKGTKLIKQWVTDEACIASLNNEALVNATNGKLIHPDEFNFTIEQQSNSAGGALHDSGIGKFLNEYISNIERIKNNSQLAENLRSRSGSFLRMQLEVLDIGFAHPVSRILEI